MKSYYFSTSKHAHDIELRRNRCFNTIMDIEQKGECAPKYLYDLLTVLDEIRDYMAGACGRAVLLPANLYCVAMETVGWAASVR